MDIKKYKPIVDMEYLSTADRNLALRRSNARGECRAITDAMKLFLKSTAEDEEGKPMSAVIAEDGTVVALTNAELLVQRTIQDAIENPSAKKLQILASIIGDTSEIRAKIGIDEEERKSSEDLFGDCVAIEVNAKEVEKEKAEDGRNGDKESSDK